MSRSARTVGLALLVLLLGGPGRAGGEGRPNTPTAQKRPKKRPHGAPLPPPAPPAPLPAPQPLRSPPLQVERFSLENGLRVVLSPIPGASTTVLAMLYDAGAQREARGSAGLANWVRRAMNLGSANLLRGEHERYLAMRGGRWWSELSGDRALYATVLPPGELALGLWLEADRLKSLHWTSEGALAQREQLHLELQRRAPDPLLDARDRLRGLVFQSYWPYEHAPEGTPAELSALRPEAAQSFHETYYTASNAILVVAGALETEQTNQLIHRFFETARRQERPAATTTPPPEQTSQRTAHLEAPRGRAPRLLYGWATPGRRTDDAIATEAALHILTAQRLPVRLQRERGLASDISFSQENLRPAGFAVVEISLTDAAAQADAERAVDAEVEALAQKGPSEAELAAFRAHAEAQLWRTYEEIPRLAVRLGDMELLHGDASQIVNDLPRVTALNREQVRAAAARYLSQNRRSFVRFGVDPASAPAPTPAFAPQSPPGKGKPHRPHRPTKPRPHR